MRAFVSVILQHIESTHVSPFLMIVSLCAPDTIYVSSLIYSLQFYLHPPIITTWKALGSISQINCQCGEGVIGRVCVKLSAWCEYKVRDSGHPNPEENNKKLNSVLYWLC